MCSFNRWLCSKPHPHLRKGSQGWGDGLVVKSIGAVPEGPHSNSLLCVTPVSSGGGGVGGSDALFWPLSAPSNT